jgi:hypothetical protein
MNPALEAMIARYPQGGVDESINALREVLQELALLGLWRGKFFERAAFYGGTALRVLYGLDRFSEDLDFSLLKADPDFHLNQYLPYVEKELAAWGFGVTVELKEKTAQSALESAFLKANTKAQLLVIRAARDLAAGVHPDQVLRIKLEVDTDPPPGFATETRFCLQPVPFSVLAYSQPSLFAGKMHALLCRGWGNRVKGRDWYDLVWYVARGIPLDLPHLEARMRQSGHHQGKRALSADGFRQLLEDRISNLEVPQARADVVRFLTNASAVEVWSNEFFRAVAAKVRLAP